MRAAAPALLVGVDEAGRGAWVGPLVVGAVAVLPQEVDRLREIGARDSKLLSPRRREEVYARLQGSVRMGSIEIPPEEIDRHVRRGKLNELEARAFGEVARPFAPARVHVDACDTDARRFGRSVARHGGPGLHVVARHHADRLDPVVAAASIVAKVRRDRAVRRLSELLGQNVGSGYPSDPTTVEVVRAIARPGSPLPDWLRSSWRTTQRVISGRPARSLERFAP